MIKKLLVLGMLVFTTHSILKAQTTPTVVTDTLSYFYNKQLFKIPNATGVGFPYYKSAAATVTNITHMGSVFLNTDPDLQVHGLEARLAFQVNSNNVSIPVRLYLYNVNASLLPTSIIDSITVNVGVGQADINSPTGYQVGGAFSSSLGPVSHNVPGNFAVMVRNLSLQSGDTVRIYRTGAVNPGHPSYSNQTNMGEGLGRIRFNGVFYSTNNYNHPRFGTNTNYEFCVAPIVTYTLIADHIAPYPVDDFNVPPDSVMCGAPLAFTNTSTSHWTNRFFNLNQFYRHFWPYAFAPTNGFPADSSISWYFDDEDFDNPNLRPNIPLKVGATVATKHYDSSGCFTKCSLRARLTKMIAGGNGGSFRGNIEFSVCVSYLDCWRNLEEQAALNSLVIYPNPSEQNKVQIRGLKGNNTIEVFDVLGRLRCTIVSKAEEETIDLLKEPSGTYLIKVTNEKQFYRGLRVIHQRE